MFFQWRVAQRWHFDPTRTIHLDTKDPIAAFKKDDLRLQKLAAATNKAAVKETLKQASKTDSVQVIFYSEHV